MSQVYSIVVAENQSDMALSRFLDEWRSVGSYELTENGYSLNANSGETGLVSVEDHEIVFQGRFSEEGIDLILALAEALDSELLLEGEPLDTSLGLTRWQDFGWLEKTSGVMLLPVMLFMILLYILALPILLIIMLVRLLFVMRKNET